MTIISKHEAEEVHGDREATLRLINWFSLERVRAAKILVVGAGAIGNEVLKNLALLGVGNIFIIDKDIIEMSNLTRSVLYRETDCDQPKALVAARGVQNLNPKVKARWMTGDLRFDLGLGFIRQMDVVIAGLDNMMARDKINKLCLQAGRPWVDAGIGVLDGHVCVYTPQFGACYACYYSKERLSEIQRSCAIIASRDEREGKVATTPTIASIVAGVQVQEALKLLHVDEWEGRTLVSRKFSFNGSDGDARMMDLIRRPDCENHFTIDPALIVKMESASAHRTTVAELLDQVEEMVGGPVSIELNYDLAVELRCECKAALILKPVEKLFKEDLHCSKCGWQPERKTALKPRNILARNFVDEYPDDLGRARLIDIGIPPLDIMRVYTDADHWTKTAKKRGRKSVPIAKSASKNFFIELAGDLRPDLNFNEL